MRNSTIPDSEKFKINQKMKFQAKHSNILSIPNERNVRNKFDSIEEYHAKDIKFKTGSKRNSVIERHGRNNNVGYNTIQDGGRNQT